MLLCYSTHCKPVRGTTDMKAARAHSNAIYFVKYDYNYFVKSKLLVVRNAATSTRNIQNQDLIKQKLSKIIGDGFSAGDFAYLVIHVVFTVSCICVVVGCIYYSTYLSCAEA